MTGATVPMACLARFAAQGLVVSLKAAVCSGSACDAAYICTLACQGAPWLAMRYLPSVLSTLKRSRTVMLRFWLNGDTSALRVYGAYMGTTMSKSGRTQWKPMGSFHSNPQPSELSFRCQVGVSMDLPWRSSPFRVVLKGCNKTRCA